MVLSLLDAQGETSAIKLNHLQGTLDEPILNGFRSVQCTSAVCFALSKS